jgi:hypothetical protein
MRRIAPRGFLAQLGELLAHESAVEVWGHGSFFRLV